MNKILYCIDKSSKKKASLPFPFDETSKISDISNNSYPLVIFEEKFLKRRKNIKLSLLNGKICLIHFSKKDKNNLKTVRKYRFFDYFTDEDTKTDIAFKLKRLDKIFQLENSIEGLKNQIAEKDRDMKRMSFVDPLTGCYNWRYFLNQAKLELSRVKGKLHNVSFIAIDIDHFRRINEVYGIGAADAIIKEFVYMLNLSLRKHDMLFRWREDEFFIIMPHQKDKGINEAARRLKDKITSYKFKYKWVSLSIKVSLGVVSSPADNVFDPRDVITALGICISQAKRRGGNDIILYSQPRFESPEKAHKTKANTLREKIEKMSAVSARDVLDMIYGFARAIEVKDFYTGKHVEYTAALAEDIAKALHLSAKEVANIKHAAVLHDLGKVGIDESILSKNGPLSTKEREIIKSHPSIAAEILREIHALRGAIPAILYHHERYDGKGYPLGLKAQEIPLGARIVAIADVYQALISDRPYRKAFSRKKSLDIIIKESGEHFDPEIVKIFLKVVTKINGER